MTKDLQGGFSSENAAMFFFYELRERSEESVTYNLTTRVSISQHLDKSGAFGVRVLWTTEVQMETFTCLGGALVKQGIGSIKVCVDGRFDSTKY